MVVRTVCSVVIPFHALGVFFFLRLLPGITLKFGQNLSFYDVKIDPSNRLFKED